MAEKKKLRIEFNDDLEITAIEYKPENGPWEELGEGQAAVDKITIMTGPPEGSGDDDDRYCPPRPNKCWIKINNRCYYFPC